MKKLILLLLILIANQFINCADLKKLQESCAKISNEENKILLRDILLLMKTTVPECILFSMEIKQNENDIHKVDKVDLKLINEDILGLIEKKPELLIILQIFNDLVNKKLLELANQFEATTVLAGIKKNGSKIVTNLILETLIIVDPANRDLYEKRKQ